MEHLDKIDWQIISILSKNARISLSQLSEKVYLTPPAVSSQNRETGESRDHRRLQGLHQL